MHQKQNVSCKQEFFWTAAHKVYAVIYTLKWKSIDSYEVDVPRGDSSSTESILLGECKHFRHKQKIESWKETKFWKFSLGGLFCPVSLAPYR